MNYKIVSLVLLTIIIAIVGGSVVVNADGAPPIDPIKVAETQYNIADIDKDGKVSGFDLSIMSKCWGLSECKFGDADLNNDGTVDTLDMDILRENWCYGVEAGCEPFGEWQPIYKAEQEPVEIVQDGVIYVCNPK